MGIYRHNDSAQSVGVFDKEFIEGLPESVKYICHNGAGYDQSGFLLLPSDLILPSPYIPYRLSTSKLVSPYMRSYLPSQSLPSLLSQTHTRANAPVDIAAASSRNISVSHTPGAVDDATATVGAFLTISCLRNFSLAERNGREGKWKSGWEPARDPEGRTVGIVGMGGIGQVSLSILFGEWFASADWSTLGQGIGRVGQSHTCPESS